MKHKSHTRMTSHTHIRGRYKAQRVREKNCKVLVKENGAAKVMINPHAQVIAKCGCFL